jgi:hypothetical protein
MGTKLTLSLDDAVIRRAKQYARTHRKSLSRVVEDYLAYVTESDFGTGAVSPLVGQIADTISVRETDDELKLRYLRDKYLDA